jgi:hypothetical protein
MVAAGSLAAVVAVFSVRSLLEDGRRPGAPPDPPERVEGPRIRPPDLGPPFGPGTLPRLRALRDRLVQGLLSLQAEDGGYVPDPDDPDLDAIAKTEATAMALAGLAAARLTYLGERKDTTAIDAAIARAKARVLAAQTKGGDFGAPRRPSRATIVATLSAALLGLVLVSDPADADAVAAARGALASEAVLGPVQHPWPRAVAAYAALGLFATGRLTGDGVSLETLIPTGELPKTRDAADARVVEAFVRRARRLDGGPDGFPAQIVAKSVQIGGSWGGERTDMYSWCMRAWLAARAEGGRAWFATVLPGLEAAPNDAGVVLGDLYGDPVSRTACALLILFEGWTSQPPFGA